jgi:imidazolonepropionase-like amidohydrolase
MVRAGIPDREVVAAASWRTRAWLGAENLDEGASADLVVYAADPRRDVAELGRPRAVVLRGARVR